MMTEEQLAAIQARCDAATPPPWYVHEADGEDAETGEPWAQLDGIEDRHGDRLADEHLDWESDEDFVFVTHARTDVPDLLAEIRRLREVVRLTEDALAELTEKVEWHGVCPWNCRRAGFGPAHYHCPDYHCDAVMVTGQAGGPHSERCTVGKNKRLRAAQVPS